MYLSANSALMDKLLGQDKENILTFPMFSIPTGNLAHLDDNQSKLNAAARAKGKSKTQKAANNSVRAGDWVCLLCNNLNFSFRAECNRCGLQTKKENYIQNLLQISEPTATTVTTAPTTDRRALKDLTNTQHLIKENLHKVEEKEKPKLSYELPPGLELSVNRSHSAEYVDDKPLGFHSNFGFNSVLLLTPPRGANQSLTSQQNTYEKSESRNNMLPPYQSPQQQLPSISPILRKIFENEPTAPAELKERPSIDRKLTFKRNLDFSESEAETKSRISYSFGEEHSNEVAYFKEIDNFVKRDDSENLNSRVSMVNTRCEGIPEPVAKLNFSNVHQSAIQFGCNLQKITLPFLEEFAQKKAPHQQSYQQHNDQVHLHHLQQPVESQPKKERKSDWICNKCGNLNYSFRKFCNRCQTDR